MSSRCPLVAVVVLAVTATPAIAHGKPDDGKPGGKSGGKRDDGKADDEPLIAVVRVSGEDDAAVLARIEGQTSDLDVTLRVARARARPDDSDADELRDARALAARYHARVVVWFRRDTDAWIVYVSEPDADRLLIRRIATGGDQMAGSAAAEAAALVVRTALRALAAGGTIGVDAPEPEPPPPPPPAPIVVAPAPPPPPRVSPVHPVRAYGALLSRSVVDGASDLGQHGVSGQVGAAGGRWRVAATGAYLPPVAHSGPDARIEVQRLDLGVALGIDLIGAAGDDRDGAGAATAPSWRVTGELGLGVARYGRRTTSASNPLMATPSAATWAAAVSPTARLARRIGHGAWIELALGIDLIGNAPEFGVASGDTFTVLTRLWPAEPHAGLGLLLDTF